MTLSSMDLRPPEGRVPGTPLDPADRTFQGPHPERPRGPPWLDLAKRDHPGKEGGMDLRPPKARRPALPSNLLTGRTMVRTLCAQLRQAGIQIR